MTAAKELAGLILASTDSEATNTPFWGICVGNGNPTLLSGIWFDRISAEDELETNRHRYGEYAYVYCFSGWASKQYQRVRELAREINSGKSPVENALSNAIFDMCLVASEVRRHDEFLANKLISLASSYLQVMDENE